MAPPNTLPRSVSIAGLVAILFVGFWLRTWGVESGAPNRMGADEPIVLSTAVRMMKTGDFNPRFFDYGGLTFTFHAAVSTISFLERAMSGRWSSLEQVWFGDFLIATRTATAAVGTLTILLVYLIGRRWGPRTALVAALVFAVLPPHVRESHFTLTDTPLTFFVALTLLLSIRATEAKHLRAMVFAGAAIGLTAAIKYNGVVVAVMPALAALAFPPERRMKALVVAACASAAAFLVAAPYTLLDLPAFLNGFAALMQSYNKVRATAWDAASTYLGHLRNWFGWPNVIPLVFGYVGLGLSLGGLIAAFWRRGAGASLLVPAFPIVFGIVYFLFITNQSSLVYGRYALPLAPALALGMGVALTALAEAIESRAARLRLIALPAVLLIVVGPLVASSVAWNVQFSRPLTIDQAARWVNTRPARGEIVVIEGTTFVAPPRVTLRAVHRLIDKPIETYRAEGVKYLIASSDVAETYAGDPAAVTMFRTLLGQAEVVQTFPPSATHTGPTLTIVKLSN